MATTAPLPEVERDGHHGDPHLAHHFESPAQQLHSAKLGMWVFLATELLFFGGLFCAYAVYRANHPEIFVYAHQFLDKRLGGINTLILICSSLTMAWAVRAAQLRQPKVLKAMLALTLLGAFGFLGIKFVEYRTKWEHGLLWARMYRPHVEGAEAHGAGSTPPESATAAPESATVASEVRPPGAKDATTVPPAPFGPSGLAAPDSGEAAHAAAAPHNVQIFFSIYFLMTGLHGVHVVLGIAAMFWLLMCASRGDFAGGHFTRVHMVGLYWHLVDLIWIYLFLLLYLIH
jgi:cytochrome c oxidase subunit 3